MSDYRRVLKRRNEGKTWKVIQIVESIAYVSVYSIQMKCNNIYKMRYEEYLDKSRYPSEIPCYKLEKCI